jgi:hypothetical protein
VYLEAQLNGDINDDGAPDGGYSLEKFGSYGARLNSGETRATTDIYREPTNQQRWSRGAPKVISSNNQPSRPGTEKSEENLWLLKKKKKAQIVTVIHPLQSPRNTGLANTGSSEPTSQSRQDPSSPTFHPAEIQPK